MIKVANIRGLVSMGLACTALLAQAGGALAQDNCEANGAPTIVITQPLLDENGMADTEDLTIDIKGVALNRCWVSDIASKNKSTVVTDHAQKVTTNFRNLEHKWFFEISNVELQPATEPGESEANEIEVTVSGANASQTTFVVTHTLPDDGGIIPPNGDLNLVNEPYTKGKVTWDLADREDSVSTNARLILPDGGSPIPCGLGDRVIVTVFAEGAEGRIQLHREEIDSEEAGTCHDSKFRNTGPAGGFRDMLFTTRSDNQWTFYLFGARLNWLPNPATDNFVRTLTYIVEIKVVYADGNTLVWEIELDDLSFESIYNGSGKIVRTVGRHNR